MVCSSVVIFLVTFLPFCTSFPRGRDRKEVGFHVALMNRKYTFEPYNAVKFDKVITNIGHAYDKRTGAFTSPVSGTYFFSLNALAAPHNTVELSITVNGKAKMAAVSDRQASRAVNQGIASAILSLDKGDSVTVESQMFAGQLSLEGRMLTGFSGYLLRAD